MKITFSNHFKGGGCNFVTHETDQKPEAEMILHDWLTEKNLDVSCFVCFSNWSKSIESDFRNEHSSILVTHCWDDIIDFFDIYLSADNWPDLDFIFLEFGSYKDAFEYCIDLREGF